MSHQRQDHTRGPVSGWSRLRGLLRRLFSRRVPVVLQMTMDECGLACLAMILGHHGRRMNLAECHTATGLTGHGGTTARQILAAARRLGMRARPLRLDPDKLDQLPLPLIAHWNFNHFVVIERLRRQGADIVDPALGRRRVSQEELDRSFTGIVLVMEPGVGFDAEPTGGERRGMRLRSLLWDTGIGRVFLQVLGATVLLQLLGLVTPLVTKVVVDSILPSRMLGLLGLLALALGVWLLSLLVSLYLRYAMLVYLSGRLDARLGFGFFEHLLRLPLPFFEQRTAGDLLTRLSSNAVVREVLTERTLSIILDGGLVVGYFFLLLALDWRFAVAAGVLASLQLLLLVISFGPLHRLLRQQLADHAESQGYAVETLKGIRTLKASGAEGEAFQRWSSLFARHLNTTLRRGHLSTLLQTGLGSIKGAAPLVLLWVGAARVLDGDMTLGTMFALMALSNSFLAPLTPLAASIQRIQLARAHFERLQDVLGAESERVGEIVPPEGSLAGRIEVRDLTFHYAEGSPPALEEVSFVAEPGQKIAVTGPTGSGKSTLAMLLLGMARPMSGEIRLDGHDLVELDLPALRRQIGVVLQEPFLFSGSVRQNVALNRPEATLEDVVRVCQAVGLHEDVARLPMAYETRLSEGGALLSGGQRQKLCIARALIREPRVLILDEATSSLDADAERRVDRALDALNATRIVIAHRLSTIRDADLILVLDRGSVIERGTHEELLASRGLYASLVTSYEDPPRTRARKDIPIPAAKAGTA